MIILSLTRVVTFCYKMGFLTFYQCYLMFTPKKEQFANSGHKLNLGHDLTFRL